MKGVVFEMNDVMKAMLERRSIRRYTDEMPSEGMINDIITCGLYAASGRNFQCVKIIAVTNKEKRDQIAEVNRQIGGWDEGFDPFYGAPVILIVIADKTKPNHVWVILCWLLIVLVWVDAGFTGLNRNLKAISEKICLRSWE